MRRLLIFALVIMTSGAPVLLADGKPPQAADLSALAAPDCPKHITLLAWDDITLRSLLDCTIVTPPANGTVTLENPAQAPTNSYKVVYTATNGFTGTDSFVYKANDGTQDSPPATCTISVTTNLAPIATMKMADACCGCTGEITLNALDHHTDEKYLGFTIVTPPALGTLVYRYPATYPTNSMVLFYTPTNGCSGIDLFTYSVSDGQLSSGIATCIVSIAENQVPDVSDMSQTATPGVPRKMWLNGWDAHTPTDALRFDIIDPPTNGTLVYQYPAMYPSNSVQVLYTPTNGLVDDNFTYNASDGCDTSVTATCTITIETNTPPSASFLQYTTTTNTPRVEIPLNAWDNHTDQMYLECTIESQPVDGEVTYQYPGDYPTNSRYVVFTLTNAVTGTNEFTYRASDGDQVSVLATCRVTVVENTAPTANAGSYTLGENQYKDMYLSVSDAETWNDLECMIVSPPLHGVVTYRYPTSYPVNSRQMRYTPFPGYHGSDSFTYKVSDGALESSAATISLTIEENTAPTANNMAVTTVELVKKLVSLDVSDNESSASYLECIVVDPPDHGTLIYRYPANYPVSSRYMAYTADAGYDGSDSFTFKASDGELVSGVATCSVTVEVNTAPVASAMAEETVYDTPLNLSLDVSDGHTAVRDLECIIDQPTNGVVTYRYPSSYPVNSYYITYTPTNGYVGPDSFTFRATDGSLTSTPAVCSIDVTTNTPPTARDIRGTTEPDTALNLSASYDETDAGQTITAAVVSNALHGEVTVAGTTFTYTPTNGYSGMDGFTYTVNDGYDDSNIAQARIQVRDASDRASNLVVLVVNDLLLPVISNEVYRLKEDLENEGYTSKVTPWGLGGLANTSNLWHYLRSEYLNTNQFLQGAILIGDVPKARTYSYHPYYGDTRWLYTDLVFWNMQWFQQADPVATYNIWVTRISADDTNWGTQEVLIKRALDANHNYRTGKSRLPHTAFVFDCFTETPSSTTMLDVWPEVRAGGGGNHNAKYKFMPERTDIPHAACDSFAAGGEVFNETSHGNASGYMEGSWFNESALYRVIAQERHGLIGSCTSGAFGGIVNNHLFTRGGGLVFAVGGTAINYSGDFQINRSYGKQVGCRARLAAGDSWGGAVLYSYPWENYYTGNRIVFYGDLSIGAMASPSNAMPVIDSLVVSKSNPVIGEPVSFIISMTDSNAASSDSPYADYEHQVEWFMNGYNYGRNDPTYVTNDTQTASWTNITHAFSSAGSYTIRVEVMDEWKARVWKERTITVNTAPVASNDTAEVEVGKDVSITVLANDTDADGHNLSVTAYTDPLHGALTQDGNVFTYATTNTWTGVDSFTYSIQDTQSATDSATVTVTVVADSTPPGVSFVEASPTALLVIFDEAVEPGSGPGGAENVGNYAITAGISITNAVLAVDGQAVTLGVSGLVEGWMYTLTVSNVRDASPWANAIVLGIDIPFALSEAIGEAGLIVTNQADRLQWHQVSLQRTYTNPVVIMGPPSYTDADPITVRVRNVTGTSFEWQMAEWDYQDGVHGVETTAYVVVEAGVHALGNGAVLQAGTTTVNSNEQAIVFPSIFSQGPVVFSQVVSHNETNAVVTRQQNVTASQVSVSLQGEQSRPLHGDELVAWLALEPGIKTHGALFEAGQTGNEVTHSWHTLAFAQAYPVIPAVLGNMQTLDGADPAGVRLNVPGTNSTQVKVEEEESGDTETDHADEVVGYWTLEPGDIRIQVVDTDGDGWLNSHDADDDNDGMSDSDEALAGTDPTNRNSVLECESCEKDESTGDFVVRWQSVAGRYYSVISSTNLPAGFDALVVTNLGATPPQNCYTDTVERAKSVFYRVLLDE